MRPETPLARPALPKGWWGWLRLRASRARQADQDGQGREWPRPHRISIKGALLLLMLPGLALVINLDQLADYRSMRRATDLAYDRALHMALVSLQQQSRSWDLAGGHVDPRDDWVRALTESADAGVYFSVRRSRLACAAATADGQWRDADVLAGQAGLSLPAGAAVAGRTLYYDGQLAAESVRVASVCVDAADETMGRAGEGARMTTGSLLLSVAETTGERQYLRQALWQSALLRGLLVTGVAGVLLWLAVTWALRPLASLRREVLARGMHALRPLAAHRVPAEVRPLVLAINHHVEQHQQLLREQTRFLDGASHQLRTPLSVLLTQAEFALREPDVAHVREGLRAMIRQLQQANRLTAQLLLLARAQHHDRQERIEAFDLAECAQQVMIDALPLADARAQDLGWEGGAETADSRAIRLPVRANASFMREAIANLVQNAIAYTPPGSTITVRCRKQAARAGDPVSAWALVVVEDNGPGIAAELRDRLFERFARGPSPARPGPGISAGSGLGLAISRSLAQRYGGEVWLTTSPTLGVSACLRLPLQEGLPDEAADEPGTNPENELRVQC